MTIVATNILSAENVSLSVYIYYTKCLKTVNPDELASTVKIQTFYNFLSFNVASGSEITPCIKIDKPLVVYKFSSNITSIK